MEPTTLAYVTLFAPLGATALITLATQRMKAVSGMIALAAILTGLVCSGLMAVEVLASDTPYNVVHEITWLSAGGITMNFGVQVDALSVLMSLIVGIVGSGVFLYSTAYMHGEDGYSRYFACISLFAFSMLGIVFSSNLIQTFIFWELVGVSSYSLIGYYFAKHSAVDASKKAFLTNRIGDFGMTVGILLLFFTLWDVLGPEMATTSFVALQELFADPANQAQLADSQATLGIAGFLIFTGAIAKSAQVPLHVWLPDAMEGPTPVSALMHAATMVAAGVYLGSRVFFLLAPHADPLLWIAIIGGVTAFLAACMAFVQHDIKKVLAFSTLSQLGYMVMALGLAAPHAAMFHLMTHAFFKALLFLGAGSVIHGCHHEQDMREMGGLLKKMPVTAWTFLIGSIALAGIPPLAGFWSKDAILGAASVTNMPLYIVGLGVAFMTAAYMGRCCFLNFFGEYRGHAKPHESPIAMTLPLGVLALLAVVSGFVNIPPFGKGPWEIADAGQLDQLLMAPGAASHFDPFVAESKAFVVEAFHWDVAIGGTIAAILGIVTAFLFYGSRKFSAEAFSQKIGPLYALVKNGYYFDDFYLWLVRSVQQGIAKICAFFEKEILINVIVNGFAALHRWLGGQIRLLLDGHLHRYLTLALLGVVFILTMVLRAEG